MRYTCPTCGKKGGLAEFETKEFSSYDYANINIFSEDPTHSLDILYLLPPWRCEDCKSVLLRGAGTKIKKETVYSCNICKEGVFNEFENAAIGDIVIRDTYEKVGKLTIDEAIICDNCGFLRVIESGKEIADSE